MKRKAEGMTEDMKDKAEETYDDVNDYAKKKGRKVGEKYESAKRGAE